MTTEAKFKRALKEMMLSKPLSEINVTSLCEACHCHRQTFYYHYQDIYDLLAAIFLNEEVEGLTRGKDVNDVLLAVLQYCKTNFVFLRSSYNSAASDLVDDFIYSKVATQIIAIFNKKNDDELTKSGYRSLSRRFSRIVSDEFGYYFKNVSVTPGRFEKAMRKFITNATAILLPALKELSKEESKK